MVKAVKGLFGSSDQEKLLRKQQRDLRATEEGQRRVREGGRGLLAFIDDELASNFGSVAGDPGGLGRRALDRIRAVR